MVQLSYPYMAIGKTIALTRWTFVSKMLFIISPGRTPPWWKGQEWCWGWWEGWGWRCLSPGLSLCRGPSLPRLGVVSMSEDRAVHLLKENAFILHWGGLSASALASERQGRDTLKEASEDVCSWREEICEMCVGVGGDSIT